VLVKAEHQKSKNLLEQHLGSWVLKKQVGDISLLGGGLNHFLFSPRKLGKMNPF